MNETSRISCRLRISNSAWPPSAWGRKTRADIEIRYTDGMVAYCEPVYGDVGLLGSVVFLDAARERDELAHQTGIWLEINGMAVGGKRRITIQPELVSGGLLLMGIQRHQEVGTRKETLTVEAIL